MLAIPKLAMTDWGYSRNEADTWRNLRDAATSSSFSDSTPKPYANVNSQDGLAQRSNAVPLVSHHSHYQGALQSSGPSHQSLHFQDNSNEPLAQDVRLGQYATSSVSSYANMRPQDISSENATYGLLDRTPQLSRHGDASSYAPSVMTGLRRPSVEQIPGSDRFYPTTTSGSSFNPRASSFLPQQSSSGVGGSSLTGSMTYSSIHGERPNFGSTMSTVGHESQSQLPTLYPNATLQQHHGQPQGGFSSQAPLTHVQHGDHATYHYGQLGGLGDGVHSSGSTSMHTLSHFSAHHHGQPHGQAHFGFHDYRSLPIVSPFEIKHRRRTTRAQYKVLNEAFQKNHKPTAATRKALSEQTGMPLRSVQIWFQNSRAKLRREERARGQAKADNMNSPLDGASGRSGTADSREAGPSSSTQRDNMSRLPHLTIATGSGPFAQHSGSSSMVPTSSRSLGGDSSTHPFGFAHHPPSSEGNSRPNTSALSEAYGMTPRLVHPSSQSAPHFEESHMQQQQQQQQTTIETWRNNNYMESFPDQKPKWA